MSRSLVVPLVAMALVLVSAVPSHAWHGHGRWWGHHHHWHHPRYYVYTPPPVVAESPPVYVQQDPPPAEAYWHYCPSSQAYYPNVPTCSEAWIRVPPRSP